MQIYLIAIITGIITYLIVSMLVPISEKEILRGRISKYFYVSTYDDAAKQVEEEQNKLNKMKKTSFEKLLSNDFSEYVYSSYIKITPSEFLIMWFIAAILPATIFSIYGTNILTVFAFLVIGLVLPPYLLMRARKKRQDLFTSQLGEALIVMSNAVRSGFSFTQAMENVALEMQPPINIEFSKCIREMQYGISQEDALNKMADKIKNEDLNLLVSAVLTSSDVGGNLSDILDSISATIKDRIRIKQEVKVLTSTGRMSAIIIALLPIFIVLVLMIINPEYFNKFIETNIGKVMIMLAAVLEITGFIFIKKISDIQY